MSKKNPKCSPYDLRALEQWLAELAADGLELGGEWREFDEGEKQEKQFYIEPVQEKGGVPKTLLDSRAMMGWEYVCSMDKGAFYVWRSVGVRANPPRPREMTGSWCDKRLGRRLLYWWLGELTMPLFLAALAVWYLCDVKLPLWTALVNAKGQWSAFSLLVGFFCALWGSRRERRDLLRLRKAVRAGEYQEPVAQHKAWYGTMRWLPTVVALAIIFVPLTVAGGRPITMAGEYPFLAAEDLGGTAGEREAARYDTPLCRYAVEGEGEFRGYSASARWVIRQTHLEVYRPRLSALAKPLAAELRDYYVYQVWQVLSLDSIDEAYYWTWPDGVQCLLLRDDGMVLFYHTDAPDDLRQHLGEFASLLTMYREVVLTR